MSIAKRIEQLPRSPGIYLFYDRQQRLLYVGKATSLRSRVQSYWRGQRTPRPIEQMIHEVDTIKHVVTDSVLEAIILESIYIKKHRPKYNVLGRDDKSWNYITISREPYPHVGTLRQHELSGLQKDNDQALKRYRHIFGPYPGLNTKATLKLLRSLFQFSNCAGNKRPCLYYQMGKCLGVCTKEISPRLYQQKVIRPLVLFLQGKKQQVIKRLEQGMRAAAKTEQFEEAARIRNQLYALQRIQDIALLNRDFFGEQYAELSAESSVSRIEGYDISNLGTAGKVGSMVVFDRSGPVKSHYRKFKIKTVEGQSDVDSLAEVLTRRLNHPEWPLPQVFLIDGGVPQVNTAKRIIKEAGLAIPVVGIAKGAARKKNEFVLGQKNKEFVAWVNRHRLLLIKVRDEAHRFAIQYQRTLRRL